MKPCIRCHRHVRRAEPLCPFCGAPLVDALAPPAVLGIAWSLGAVLVACGPGLPPETDSTSTSTGDGASSTGAATTATNLPTSSTATTTASSDAVTTTTGCADGCSSGFESAAFIYGAPDIFGPDLGCDPFAQDCAVGEKCIAVDSWTSTRCVPLTGDRLPGEPCVATDAPAGDDCQLGAMCWNLDADQHGTCVALCTGSPDAPVCPADRACFIGNEGVLNVCLIACDPLAPACPDGEACLAASDQFLCILDASGDEGQLNDPCEFVNGCDPGLACLDTAAASAACQPGETGCCQPFCEFPDAPCPNPDQQCVQWFPADEIPPGAEHIGVCAIPS